MSSAEQINSAEWPIGYRGRSDNCSSDTSCFSRNWRLAISFLTWRALKIKCDLQRQDIEAFVMISCAK